MTPKKWILKSSIIIFTILIFNVLFLFIIDTYSIVNSQPQKCYTIPNQKYLIVEYLLNNKQTYDTLIFGSSRVGKINPLHVKDKKAYNMTYGEGIPHEHLIILKYFIKQNLPIKHILIGLDDFSYQVSFAQHQQQLTPKSHYLTTSESILDFYKFYFFRKPNKKDLKHIQKKYFNLEYNKYLINLAYNTIFNQHKFYLNSSCINNHTKKHINSPIFTIPTHYSGNELKNTLEDINELAKLAKINDINITFFINPIHKTTYNDTNKKLLKKFRNGLSKITSYYDFSFPNTINNNNAYWLETSHYNYNVGDMILSRIYDNNTSIKDFGIYIEKKEKNKNAI